jgi:hypothetical protein
MPTNRPIPPDYTMKPKSLEEITPNWHGMVDYFPFTSLKSS